MSQWPLTSKGGGTHDEGNHHHSMLGGRQMGAYDYGPPTRQQPPVMFGDEFRMRGGGEPGLAGSMSGGDPQTTYGQAHALSEEIGRFASATSHMENPAAAASSASLSNMWGEGAGHQNYYSSVTGPPPIPGSTTSGPPPGGRMGGGLSFTTDNTPDGMMRSASPPSPLGNTPLLEPNPNLYVHNVPRDSSEDELKELFGRFGTVERVRLKVNPKIGPHAVYAFVTFSNVMQAQTALNMLQGADIRGRRLRVEFQKTPTKNLDDGEGRSPSGNQYRQQQQSQYQEDYHSGGDSTHSSGGPGKRTWSTDSRRETRHHQQRERGQQQGGPPYKRGRFVSHGGEITSQAGDRFVDDNAAVASSSGPTAASGGFRSADEIRHALDALASTAMARGKLSSCGFHIGELKRHLLLESVAKPNLPPFLAEAFDTPIDTFDPTVIAGLQALGHLVPSGADPASSRLRYALNLNGLVGLLKPGVIVRSSRGGDHLNMSATSKAGSVMSLSPPIEQSSALTSSGTTTGGSLRMPMMNPVVVEEHRPPFLPGRIQSLTGQQQQTTWTSKEPSPPKLASSPQNVTGGGGIDLLGQMPTTMITHQIPSPVIENPRRPEITSSVSRDEGEVSLSTMATSGTIEEDAAAPGTATTAPSSPPPLDVLDSLLKTLAPKNPTAIVWNGVLTRSDRKKVMVSLRELRGDLQSLVSGTDTLNVSHRSPFDEMLKKNLSAVGLLLPSDSTQEKLFADYVTYFKSKNRAGVVRFGPSGTAVTQHWFYIVPPVLTEPSLTALMRDVISRQDFPENTWLLVIAGTPVSCSSAGPKSSLSTEGQTVEEVSSPQGGGNCSNSSGQQQAVLSEPGEISVTAAAHPPAAAAVPAVGSSDVSAPLASPESGVPNTNSEIL